MIFSKFLFFGGRRSLCVLLYDLNMWKNTIYCVILKYAKSFLNGFLLLFFISSSDRFSSHWLYAYYPSYFLNYFVVRVQFFVFRSPVFRVFWRPKEKVHTLYNVPFLLVFSSFFRISSHGNNKTSQLSPWIPWW